MNFVIDRETYNDLEIFSSPDCSLFSILNSTRTLGAERLLKETMHEVLNNVDEIAERKEQIRFFCTEQIEFDVSAAQMENINFYLYYFHRNCLKANIIDSVYDYWSYRLNPSQGYYQITTGVWDLIRLLRSIKKFVEEIHEKVNYQSIMKGAGDLERLMSDKVVKKNMDSGKMIGYRDLSYLDNLFRRKEKEALKLIVQWTYKIDMVITLSTLVNEKGWCLPEYLDAKEGKLSGEGLYHPGIQEAVSNDFTTNNRSNVTFLTGPNMAGKSSFLKTVGISIYLAHLGFPVPARKFSTPVFNGLVTTINLPDNIHEGLSHFYSETQRIRNTALKLAERGK